MVSVKEELWTCYETSKASFDPEEYVLIYATGIIDCGMIARFRQDVIVEFGSKKNLPLYKP